MMIRRLLAARGFHYLVTRFGPTKLRSLAFDEKYRRGDWSSHTDGTGELPVLIKRYLRKGDLLIMGCGGCSVLEGLNATEMSTALGIDLSQEAIHLAGRYTSERISFQTADMVTFECPRAYDVILFSESLYYVPSAQQEALLRRLGGQLKPGGVFVVTFAQAKRYEYILELIRKHFAVQEDRTFSGSSRHVIVFNTR